MRTRAIGSPSKATFTAFTAHCIDFPNAQYLEVAVVAAKVLEPHRKIRELLEMAQHPTLHLEKPVVQAIEYGMRECIRMRKPVSATFFLAGELEDTHIEDGGLDKNAIHAKLKEPKSAYSTKDDKQEFQEWHLQMSTLMGSTSTLVALVGGAFAFAGGAYAGQPYPPGGPAGQNSIPGRGGGGGASGHYGPNYAHAGRGPGYHRGRGAFGTDGRGGGSSKPVCGACSHKGVASDQTIRTVCVSSQPATTGTTMAMLSRTTLTRNNNESGQGRGCGSPRRAGIREKYTIVSGDTHSGCQFPVKTCKFREKAGYVGKHQRTETSSTAQARRG